VSRELTDAERIEQIGWEITSAQLEEAQNRAEAKVREIDLRADPCEVHSNAIAMHLRFAAQAAQTIANLRYELSNLTRRAA
jgi:hypothetical protein